MPLIPESYSMSRIAIAVVIVLVISQLSGCVVAAVGGAAAGGYYVGQDERSVGQIADDVAITAAVKASLIREKSIKALDINVDTHLQVVTLNGQVYSWEQEALANKIARKAKGVKRVISNLHVADVTVEEKSAADDGA
jgi:hyperosmotically inducible periplasmic protein